MCEQAREEEELSLGQYIGEAIDRSGLKRDEIAERIGVHGSYLSRIRSGEGIPSRTVLEALIRELDLDPKKAWKLYEEALQERQRQREERRFRAALNFLSRHFPESVEEEFKRRGYPDREAFEKLDQEGYPYSDKEVNNFFEDTANQVYALGLLGKTLGKDQLTMREKRMIYLIVKLLHEQ